MKTPPHFLNFESFLLLNWKTDSQFSFLFPSLHAGKRRMGKETEKERVTTKLSEVFPFDTVTCFGYFFITYFH